MADPGHSVQRPPPLTYQLFCSSFKYGNFRGQSSNFSWSVRRDRVSRSPSISLALCRLLRPIRSSSTLSLAHPYWRVLRTLVRVFWRVTHAETSTWAELTLRTMHISASPPMSSQVDTFRLLIHPMNASEFVNCNPHLSMG